jgi:hypothetical protein
MHCVLVVSSAVAFSDCHCAFRTNLHIHRLVYLESGITLFSWAYFLVSKRQLSYGKENGGNMENIMQ